MVNGLKLFKERFSAYANQYVLIGGAACDLLMEEAGLEFRATKDLDIVLNVEALDASFIRAFWDFVKAGQYQVQQSSTGERRYYRFMKPKNIEYPFMLELFARKPDVLNLSESAHLTPIPIDEEISSLSAILLNDAYYVFLHSGKRVVEGISIVDPEHLIPLKARAWLDLTQRKKAGDAIDSKSIAKHKNDVFRLYRLVAPNFKADIPLEIREDMNYFLDSMNLEDVNLKSLGISNQTLGSILDSLRRMYV